jgi:predicted ATPase
VFRVEAEGLGQFHGRLATQEAVAGNLPRPLSDLVGRALELKRLVAELGARRLLTLTGAGGVGKTRLAVEAGWLGAGEFPDGVWLVDLGPVSDPAAVVFAAATAFGVVPREGLSLEDAIADALAGRRVLVIVDNCEHVIDAAAGLARRILADCPSATVLATSREPLGLPGERVHVVASLDPFLEGVELFCQRATATDDAFVCGEDDAAVIGDICARLDGIPLAIELAAARVRSMTPADIHSRLDDRFRVLRGGGRGGVERHQTLRAAVAWSYQLLTAQERAVFERATVFAGGFDVRAAHAVCDDDVGDVLASLVDKSMLSADRTSRSARYRLLETLRQYGEERLAEGGEAEAARDRHLAYYRSVAQEAAAAYAGPRQLEAVRTVGREWDNFRGAYDWAMSSGAIDAAIALANPLGRIAVAAGRFEHGEWVEALTRAAPAEHPGMCALHANAALWAGGAGEFDDAARLARLGLERARSCPDPTAVLTCSLALGMACGSMGRGEEALEAVRSAEPLVGDDPYRQGAWLQVAIGVSFSTDPGAARRYNARFAELAAALGAPLWLAMATNNDAVNLLFDGRPREALAAFQEVLRLCEDTPCMARTNALGGIASAAAELDAPDLCRDALRQLYDAHRWMGVWIALERLGFHWVETSRLEPGAAVLGHLDAHRPVAQSRAARRAAALEVLRAHPETSGEQARGAAMTREQLVEYVLAQLDAGGDASAGR